MTSTTPGIPEKLPPEESKKRRREKDKAFNPFCNLVTFRTVYASNVTMRLFTEKVTFVNVFSVEIFDIDRWNNGIFRFRWKTPIAVQRKWDEGVRFNFAPKEGIKLDYARGQKRDKTRCNLNSPGTCFRFKIIGHTQKIVCADERTLQSQGSYFFSVILTELFCCKKKTVDVSTDHFVLLTETSVTVTKQTQETCEWNYFFSK